MAVNLAAAAREGEWFFGDASAAVFNVESQKEHWTPRVALTLVNWDFHGAWRPVFGPFCPLASANPPLHNRLVAEPLNFFISYTKADERWAEWIACRRSRYRRVWARRWEVRSEEAFHG